MATLAGVAFGFFGLGRRRNGLLRLRLHRDAKRILVLFSSNPHGNNQESIQGERYGAYHELETWRCRMAEAGFVELEHYYRPAGLPREQQAWLASVWRRSST